MEKAAIQHIEQNAVAEVIGAHLAALNLPVVLTPKAYKLESIEKYLPSPARFRGTFRTAYVGEFANYVDSDDAARSVRCFIDPEEMSASAYLDLGSSSAPGHGEHAAHVKLEPLVEHKAVLNANGKQFNQRDLAEWIEDWRDNLTAFASGSETPMDIKEAIAAVRALTVETKVVREHKSGDMSASKSALETIDASSREKTLPAFLHFKCQTYGEIDVVKGLLGGAQVDDRRTFVLRLGVLTEVTPPSYKLRIIQLERHVEDMAQAFKELVKQALPQDAVVRIGGFTR